MVNHGSETMISGGFEKAVERERGEKFRVKIFGFVKNLSCHQTHSS